MVTLVSDEGAFGGPLRVALNQVAELRRRGHEAMIVGGWRGGGVRPTHVEGVQMRLFRVRHVVPTAGFSGLFAPGLSAWLRQARPSWDLVHVHAGRDLVSLQAMRTARRTGLPFVAQTHGMVRVDRRLRARLTDQLALRRELAGADRQLVLTDEEETDLPLVLRGRVSLQRIRNGVTLPVGISRAATQEILYCARFHERKRPEAFVDMAAVLRARGVSATFQMFGPDEGALAGTRGRISARGLGEIVKYGGALPYEQVLHRMSQAAVYVLPSVDEPFPMTLLEAMSLGVACVCTDSTGISAELESKKAALVTDGSPAQMADAVQYLLDNPIEREKLGARGQQTVQTSFSIENVVDMLESIYSDVLSGVGAKPRDRGDNA